MTNENYEYVERGLRLQATSEFTTKFCAYEYVRHTLGDIDMT